MTFHFCRTIFPNRWQQWQDWQ